MEIRSLNREVSVSAQIATSDILAIKQAGFRSIICNRPDGEGPDQPLFSEIQRVAAEFGLPAFYLPAESGKVSDAQGAAFGNLLEEVPRPVLAYCRTGMRSTTL